MRVVAASLAQWHKQTNMHANGHYWQDVVPAIQCCQGVLWWRWPSRIVLLSSVNDKLKIFKIKGFLHCALSETLVVWLHTFHHRFWCAALALPKPWWSKANPQCGFLDEKQNCSVGILSGARLHLANSLYFLLTLSPGQQGGPRDHTLPNKPPSQMPLRISTLTSLQLAFAVVRYRNFYLLFLT